MNWLRRRLEVLGMVGAAERLNRVHAVMSGTNRLILRRPNPFDLLEGVCQLAIDAGHMDLAIVTMVDGREAHRSSARTATSPELTAPRHLLEGARLQAAMAAWVAHTGRCVIVDNATSDDRLEGFRSWCETRGLRALAGVPLRRGGVLVGTLILGSGARSCFAGRVTPLITELGADLSFALDNADIERERVASQQADHARRVAEDANRAKTEFLAQMSHELRTPLNAMLGFVQLLATDKVDVLSATQAERVRLVTHAGWHLRGLVNDVMDISRIESRRFEVHNVVSDISSVLDEALSLTQPLARTHRVELAERAPSPLGIGAIADPRRLGKVFLNLLRNACKYNRPGGHVRVDVRHAGAEVYLDVVDDGVGMAQEHLLHMFEPFNRLGNEGAAIEGSGIGLTLTRQLLELMDGRLEFESHPDAGTRARVVLPSCAIPPRAPSEASRHHDRTADSHPVVLYIEDDPVNRILVAQMLLRIEGVRLLLAESGGVGIAMARQHQPDLLLLDMQLPDMSGYEVLKALRNDPSTGTLPVVAVSANATEADVAEAIELGASDYWTKPLNLDEFLAGVSSRLGLSAGASQRADEESTTEAPLPWPVATSRPVTKAFNRGRRAATECAGPEARTVAGRSTV